MNARRELTVTVLACAAGSALVLFAASRVWAEATVAHPAPLPATVVRKTGASLAPLLPALALVSLASAGALLATRGFARTAVGFLTVAAGAGQAVAALWALGPAGAAVTTAPVACALAAAVVIAAGAVTVRRGASWPHMGTRYERAPDTATAPDGDLWAALDRGEDPTR